jgi:hypothetical protein
VEWLTQGVDFEFKPQYLKKKKRKKELQGLEAEGKPEKWMQHLETCFLVFCAVCSKGSWVLTKLFLAHMDLKIDPGEQGVPEKGPR